MALLARSAFVVALAFVAINMVFWFVRTEATTPAADKVTSPPSGCADQPPGSIREASLFTPYEDRLSHLPPELPITEGPAVPNVIPDTARYRALRLYGLDRRFAAADDTGGVTVYFFSKDLVGLTRSELLDGGGIELVEQPHVGNRWFAAYLLERFPERVIPVLVGSFEGALTWSDPNANGLRPHNVYWHDADREYSLTVNLPPEAAVNVARSLIC
jgi:hypothetical protein